MKNIFLLALALVLGSSAARAQLSTTVTMSGSPIAGSPFSSLAAAITAINGLTITGPVVATAAAGTETSPSGGYVITAQGTSGNTIVIQGAGAVNTIITAPSPAGALGAINDAIFKLIGADYITLQGFSMNENPLNTTTAPATNNMVEWGVALLHASVTNGCQDNRIQNNAITLNRSYANTWGIYSNNNHSATNMGTSEPVISAITGSASGNKVYGNTISNVNMGIAFIGTPTGAYQDTGNDIGGNSSATGNLITNWGGAAAQSSYVTNSGTSYCIFLNHQVGDKVSYNTLTSASISGTAVTLRGIFKNYSTTGATIPGTTTISNNTITITNNFTRGTFEHIRLEGSVNTVSVANINNNTILNSSVGGATSSSTLVGISNASSWSTVNMNDNVFRGLSSTATTGGFTAISNTSAAANSTAVNINNNKVGDANGGAITFSAATTGALLGITNAGGASTCALTMTGNDFRGIAYNVTSSATNTYIQNTAAITSQNISNNTFTNLSINTTGNLTFRNGHKDTPNNRLIRNLGG